MQDTTPYDRAAHAGLGGRVRNEAVAASLRLQAIADIDLRGAHALIRELGEDHATELALRALMESTA